VPELEPLRGSVDARGEARYVNNGVARVEKLMEQVQTL